MPQRGRADKPTGEQLPLAHAEAGLKASLSRHLPMQTALQRISTGWKERTYTEAIRSGLLPAKTASAQVEAASGRAGSLASL